MDDLEISTDKSRIDVVYVHRILHASYWAQRIPRYLVEKSIANSLCFGAYRHKRQVGFARVITDYTTFAYLTDVFVDATERGRGIGRRLVEFVLRHEPLQGLRRWHLVTADAQGLYARYGFRTPEDTVQHMELHVPNAYGLSDGSTHIEE